VAGSSPTDISSAWDAFFHDWVKPLVHFGTPALIVFAVLLILTRVLTGRLVTKDSPGIRSAKTSARWPVGVMYWFGVICLLYAAIEATVIFPLARDVMLGKKPKPPTAPPAPLTAVFSIGMVAAAAVGVWVLYCIVGRPSWREVYAPGLSERRQSGQRRQRDQRLESPARTKWTLPITAGMALAAGVLIVGIIGLWWRFQWLGDRITPGAYAPLLAALGVVIVGRARGIGMGLVIQGHDKTGGDDEGLGASVRARLYTLASHEPAGIQVTQQTDVSTLPQDALSLIPEGILAKLATLFVSLFTPATPWRADVAEQPDGSIVVSILRNGVAADAVVIRASTLWLPDRSASNAGTASTADDTSPAASGSPAGSGPPGPATAPDWTVELRTAAAAFILLTLARRYYHLRAGLSGAQDWRSVAMQVIATDPACRLSADDRRELLANAIAEDDGNFAAQLAYLYTSYRDTAGERENRLFAGKLSKLLEIVPNEEGMWPLRLRLRCNLLAAKLNEAAWFERRDDRPCSNSPKIAKDASEPIYKEAAEVRDALRAAAEQAVYLVVFWQDPENRRAFPELWDDMDVAVTIYAEAVRVEWARRFVDPMEPSWKKCEDRGDYNQAKITLLARYERACTLVGCASISAENQRSQLYTEALDVLEMVTAVRNFRTVARTDPSFAELHDIDKIKKVLCPTSAVGCKPETVKVLAPCATKEALADKYASPLGSAPDIVERFKSLTGDSCPAEFLALPVFTKHREAIEERGIHDAAALRQKAATLASELSITYDVVAQWLKVADLYIWLRTVPPACREADDAAKRDAITTALVFLLMKANLDSLPALRQELREELSNGLGQFRARLIDCARPWAVVVPGEQDIRCWQEKPNG
jgi:hypothetical protein